LHNEENEEAKERAEKAKRGIFSGVAIMVDEDMQEFQSQIQKKIEDEVAIMMQKILKKYKN